jgi:hypothetical protein
VHIESLVNLALLAFLITLKYLAEGDMKVKKIKINRGYLKLVSLNLSLGRRVICSEKDKELFEKIMSSEVLDISDDPYQDPQILILEKEDCCDKTCKELLCKLDHKCSKECKKCPVAHEPLAHEPVAPEPVSPEPVAPEEVENETEVQPSVETEHEELKIEEGEDLVQPLIVAAPSQKIRKRRKTSSK